MKAIVLGVILLWTSLAWGECAWVLWSGLWGDGAHIEWQANSGFPTQKECMTTLLHGLKSWKQQGAKVDGSYVKMAKGGVLVQMQFHCLPDTVDPRAPKAK